MSFASSLYRTVLKRYSTLTVAVLGVAFFYERGVGLTADYIFDTINKGKQWKDIKHLYEDK